MHSHEQPSLHELRDLPESGDLKFWEDETQYTIKSEGPQMWMVFRHVRPGSATPLITLHATDTGWETIEVNGSERFSADEWRALIRRAI